MKRIQKMIASFLIILFFFMDVCVNFYVPSGNAEGKPFIQVGAQKAYGATMSAYNKYCVSNNYGTNWRGIGMDTFSKSELESKDGYYKTLTVNSNSFSVSGPSTASERVTEGKSYYYIVNGYAYAVDVLGFVQSSNVYWYYLRYTTPEDITLNKVKGSLVQANILAVDGTYPLNGVYTDGYWYQKVSAIPTFNISSPTTSSAFSASFVPSISVSDADGDVLTCKYYLDAETTPKDTKQISNTATAQNVSFQMLDISQLKDGAHTITFEVSDGKAEPVKKTVAFTINRTPPKINSLTCTSAESSITVSGSASPAGTDLNALPYRYTVNGISSDWTADTSYTKSSLTPNTKYTVKFEARDKSGNTASQQEDVYTKAEKPSLSITGSSETTLNLKISDGNPAGTEYQIAVGSKYLNSSGALTDTAQWITLTNRNLTISGLQPNTQYSVSAKARNAEKIESGTAQSEKATLAQSPAITFGEIKQNSIELKWNLVPGATAYEVEADGIIKGQVTQPGYIHENLAAESVHKYRLRVVNAGGAGNWSGYFNAATLPNLPVVPANIEAVEAQTTITLTWDKVSNASSYEIEIDGGSTPVNVGSALTYVHKGLSPDVPHKYRIRAVNAGGAGKWSEYISKTTLPEPPSIPTNIKAQKMNTTVTISWSPSDRAESYRIEADGKIIDNGAATSYKAEGLPPASSHKYRVKALNRGGSSEWSETVLVITNPDKPETPSNIIATSDQSSVSLTWYKVPYADGYEIQADGTVVAHTTTESAFTQSGLNPDSKHTYRVRAVNVTGQSEWSKPVTISTFPEATGSTGGTGGTGGSGGTGGTGGDSGSGGTGDSTGSGITGDSTDLSLTNVVAIVTNHTVTLSWDAVTHNGTYEIEVDGKLTDNGKNTAYVHSGLTAETYHNYRIRVKKSNSSGSITTSDWCAVLSLSTMPDIPNAPKGLMATASGNSIELRWDKVEGASGYDIEVDGKVADAGTQEAYIQQSLDPGTKHTYRVRARNISGVTAWSEAVSQSTTNPTYTVGCKKDEEMSLSLTASDVQDFTGFKTVVTYNADELDLSDLCGFTPQKDVIPEGTVPGTNLHVKYKAGRIEITVDESITPGTMWSGEITNIVFMPKITGKTQINFTQE